jgi:transcriptional regulator with XRE-family HTH domain
LREARLASGVTQAAVGSAIGSTRRRVSQIERGRLATVPLVQLASMGSVVGLRLHARMYPAGPPLRDRAQLALLERFRRRLSPGLAVRLEVPITSDPRDQRAWDLVLQGGTIAAPFTAGVEAITRLRDVQAQLRAAQLKRHDAGVDCLILLVAATHANRRSLAASEQLLRAAFPGGTRAALLGLGAGRVPPADSLIVL